VNETVSVTHQLGFRDRERKRFYAFIQQWMTMKSCDLSFQGLFA